VWRRRARLATAAAPSSVGTLEADRQTLQALANAGADLSKPTHALFYLYFDSQEVAARALASAETTTLSGTVRPAATGQGWLLLLEGTMVPTEAAIHETSHRLSALARSLGGEYDGWEAAVEA
jgi:hypothetical protein